MDIQEINTLEKRVLELENELTTKLQQTARFEAALSENYENGTDATKNLKALSENRDAKEGMIGALKQLDIKLFKKMEIAHVECANKLDSEIKLRYEKGLKIAYKGLKGVEKSLEGIVEKNSLPALAEKLLDTCKIELWAVLDKEGSLRYRKEVCSMPVTVHRNELGERVEQPVNGPYSIVNPGVKNE